MALWKLANQGHSLLLELNASGGGAVSGTLTFEGKSYPVDGGWSASGSISGRNFSAFSLSGRTQTLPDVPDWVSAAGIMTGPGDNPAKIEIQVDVVSSSTGEFSNYNGTLLPF